MSNKSLFSLVLVGLLVILGLQTLFVVKETERALVLQFGEVVTFDLEPGIHAKIPFVQNVKKFDARILTLDSPPERFLTVGKKFVIVDSFVKWRIADVREYYRTTGGGDRFIAGNLIANLANKGLRDEFGTRSLIEVVSGERDELMAQLTKSLDDQTRAQFGIEVLDIRVKGIDLPDDLSKNVYRRMSTEREREARELRSQGRELAEGIKADADKQKVVLEAEAYKQAEQTRGEGDARAANIYASAFNRDPEFYSFTRSLKAYTETFNDQGDMLLLKPDSEFFRYMKEPKGK